MSQWCHISLNALHFSFYLCFTFKPSGNSLIWSNLLCSATSWNAATATPSNSGKACTEPESKLNSLRGGEGAQAAGQGEVLWSDPPILSHITSNRLPSMRLCITYVLYFLYLYVLLPKAFFFLQNNIMMWKISLGLDDILSTFLFQVDTMTYSTVQIETHI